MEIGKLSNLLSFFVARFGLNSLLTVAVAGGICLVLYDCQGTHQTKCIINSMIDISHAFHGTSYVH